MAAEWFYTTNKQQMGPVSWAELCELAEVGILKAHDLVWTEGMDEWVKAINQRGLFASDDMGKPAKKASYSDAKPPPARRTKRTEVEDEEDDEEDTKQAKRKARKREEETAKTAIGIKVGLILAGVVVALLLLATCAGLLIWLTIGFGGDSGPRAYTVSGLRDKTINDRSFTFTQGKRVIITCTNQLQFNNTDVDLRVFRGAGGAANERPIAWYDRLPQVDRNCRVEFIVPATDTYRVRVANLGPGVANSCRVVIEER